MIREEGDRLYISGPVTMDTAMKILEATAGRIGGSGKIIDFSEATDIDSSAVSLMLEWSRKARAAGGEVRFANPGDAIASLTDLYGVEDLIALEA
jgi:phospholipid transport system transporter-binding protein